MRPRQEPEETVWLQNSEGNRVRCPLSQLEVWAKKGYHEPDPNSPQEAEESGAGDVNWALLTVAQLRGIAKDAAIPRHSNMSKAELIEAIVKAGIAIDLEFAM